MRDTPIQMYWRIVPHISEFSRYVGSGTVANIVDIGGFWLLVHAGTYYLSATFLSGTTGFLTAFFLHKYLGNL